MSASNDAKKTAGAELWLRFIASAEAHASRICEQAGWEVEEIRRESARRVMDACLLLLAAKMTVPDDWDRVLLDDLRAASEFAAQRMAIARQGLRLALRESKAVRAAAERDAAEILELAHTRFREALEAHPAFQAERLERERAQIEVARRWLADIPEAPFLRGKLAKAKHNGLKEVARMLAEGIREITRIEPYAFQLASELARSGSLRPSADSLIVRGSRVVCVNHKGWEKDVWEVSPDGDSHKLKASSKRWNLKKIPRRYIFNVEVA
jgi:hypothetical protein